jgi:single-strand DNA-binding protein
MADIKVVEINKVMISGRLTKDPELRYTPSGVAVTTLRMAVNSSFFSKDKEKREEVCYIDVVAWRRQAETCVEYLRKGSPAFIEGRLQSRNWETQDGQKRSTIEVQADRVQFLEWAGDREKAPAGGSEQAPPRTAPPAGEDDDIPF